MKFFTELGFPVNISTNNRKMGCIPSFSLPPIRTCSPEACAHCGKKCYALKHIYKLYPESRKAWDENERAINEDLAGVERVLNGFFNSLTAPRLFRIHVGGDFFSREYFKMWVRVAQSHPDTKFLAFTKFFANINADILPENFALICSTWQGVTVPETLKGLPIAHCRLKGEDEPSNLLQCPGTCETCGVCWSINKGVKEGKFLYKGVYFDEH